MSDSIKDKLIPMADGSLVESDVLRIAEKIAEYDDNLRLKYCPPSVASMTDAPYALFELCRDGIERLVFYIWELDERVLERIYLADNAHRNVVAAVEKNNEKVKNDIQRRYEEKLAADNDIITSYLNSPKGRWSFKQPDGTKVTLDDGVVGGYKRESPE